MTDTRHTDTELVTFRCKFPDNCDCCPKNLQAFVAVRADAERMQAEHAEDVDRMERAAVAVEGLTAERNVLFEALQLLLKEMELSGNAGSKDYGWPVAITKSRAAIAAVMGNKSDEQESTGKQA